MYTLKHSNIGIQYRYTVRCPSMVRISPGSDNDVYIHVRKYTELRLE